MLTAVLHGAQLALNAAHPEAARHEYAVQSGQPSGRIFVGVLGDEKARKESIAALQHAAGFLRTEIAHSLRLRYAPELHFVLDETAEKAIRIEQLLHPHDREE